MGRADVWVFDADELGGGSGGTPLTVVTLFADTPRALAVSPDGTRVYAAGFHTGNQTTSIAETSISERLRSGRRRGTRPPTPTGAPRLTVGTIVKWNGVHWVDSLGRSR